MGNGLCSVATGLKSGPADQSGTSTCGPRGATGNLGVAGTGPNLGHASGRALFNIAHMGWEMFQRPNPNKAPPFDGGEISPVDPQHGGNGKSEKHTEIVDGRPRQSYAAANPLKIGKSC
jgi:hypothetical protein